MQQLARIARILELLLVECDQWMVFAAIDAAIGKQPLGVFLGNQTVGRQVADERVERDAPTWRPTV